MDLRGLRRLLGVCRMRSRLVGRSAATADVFRSAADQPASDTIKAGPQRRPCRNAARQQGFSARCGLRCAGPTTCGTGDASADYHTRAATFASRRRARIDTGLIDTGIAVHSWLLSPGQTQHWLGLFVARRRALPTLSPAKTSKFIADSKTDIANVPRTDNEFLGFVSSILSYDENEN